LSIEHPHNDTPPLGEQYRVVISVRYWSSGIMGCESMSAGRK